MKATRFTVPLIAALALVLGGAVFVGAQIINPPPGAFVANTVCLDKTNQDACLARNAKNVVEVNTGTAGTFAGLKVSYIGIGTTPATSGDIRTKSAGQITYRNNGNSADVNLIQSNSSDQIVLGPANGGTGGGLLLNAGTNGVVQTNGSAQGGLVIGSNGDVGFCRSAAGVVNVNDGSTTCTTLKSLTADTLKANTNLNVATGGSTSIGAGVGSVKMTSGNAATNAAWIPIQLAGTTYFVPGWTTNNP